MNRIARSHRMAPALHLAALLLLLAACGAERVEPEAARQPTFTLSERPSLVLADDGSPEHAFTTVQARRLPDGAIVVHDEGAATIALFERDGRLRRWLARRGKGPGELDGRFVISTSGDTVFALARPIAPPDVHVFTEDGGFVERRRLRSADAPRGFTLVDRLASGALLVERGSGFRALASMPDAGTLSPDSATFGLLRPGADSTSGPVVWLPRVQRSWLISHAWPRGPVPVTMSAYPLAPVTLLVASGDRLWRIDTDHGSVHALDGAGQEVAAGSLSVSPTAVDRAAMTRERDRRLALAGRSLDSAAISAQFDAGRAPATLPLVSAAHAGADGELWLRLTDVDGMRPQRFVVLDRAAREIGTATLPAGLEIQQIGRDFVLGVRRDSLGVQSVEEWGLRRP